MKMFEKLSKRYRQHLLSWKMKHGIVPRGRVAGIMGGSVINVTTRTEAKHIRNGEVIDERVVHNKKVTTAFVNDIVDNLIAETTAFGDYKFHDSGTGGTAESNSDTGMETATGIGRATGTQVEGGQTYEYQSVGTITYDGSYAVVEHGLFNNSTGGTLMDRTVFSAINVANNDQIQFTFTIQFSAEA